MKFSKLLATLLFGFGFMSMGIVEDGGGGSDTGAADAAAADAAKAAAAAKEGESALKGEKKPSDEEAKLLKEVMQKKEALQKTQSDLQSAQERLKQFDGIDPEAVRKLLEEKKNAETAQLEAKGEWDRLKTRMAEEHTSQTKSLQDQIAELQGQLSQKTGAINELSIGSQFGQSAFIAEEMVMPAAKVRVVYGDHFDLVEGKVVGYDKPRGAASRTALIDQSGEPVGFDAALRKIIDADPDKDHLLKSKIRSGADSASRKADASKTVKASQETDSVAKISAGLKGFNMSGSGGIA
ncbi:hypothetical protein QN372_00440 [Undibacterium sp. RTI2.1]|uniref:DUF6651 domain-containing protein n=1 Tax=unclassified Undibacterium TaxID=2630295 RepID=UPI002AB3F82E|nr:MULTISPECIES: DUF6651 domain-containing protein [unclassified Undibacterium]MDY7537606.1 hypothetical protein [Undibacterium sp. 5I1]MEB0029207.1 hypothetical protein [Undibacterium sp. RTI2.1]MEB0115515.1 hypothetical protein [Undibacterium sp. RTI2.2]MEB0230151.1 hypothetical protein [Undibacterium sp. 10I3]MEB0256343.1 hypothetical protein [Undibacterium sp. 5I1]